MALLGCMLMSPRIAELHCGMNPEAYYRPSHQAIHRAIAGVVSKGMEVDWITVRDQLTITGEIALAGGLAYLMQVSEFIHSVEPVAYYRSIVERCWTVRRMVAIADEVKGIALADNDDSGAVRMDKAQKRFDSIRVADPLGILDFATLDWSDMATEVVSVSTGYPSLDHCIGCRGYPVGQFSVLNAETKSGKTTFMLGSAARIAKAGGRVLYGVFGDLPPGVIAGKLMKAECGYRKRPTPQPGEDLFDTATSPTARWDEADAMRRKWNLKLWKSGGRGWEEFLAWVLEENYRQPVSVVFADYLQNVAKETPRLRGESLWDTQARVSGEMQRSTDGQPFALVTASQVTKGENGERRSFGGQTSNHDAAWVIDMKQGEQGLTTFKTSLSRFGGTGCECTLRWNEDRETLV